MKLKSKKGTITDLESMSENQFKLSTKIAIMSFHNVKYTHQTEMFIIFLEYFQLISQIVFLGLESIIEEPNLNKQASLKTINFIFKLFNPFFSLGNQDYSDYPFVPVIFSILICYAVWKYLLYAYIVARCLYNIKSYSIMIWSWKWLFKTQGRLLYFFVSSFWAGMIRGALNNLNTIGINSKGIIIISGIMIMIEYIGSLYIFTNFCYVLPTKSLLAEKNSYTQVITLTQKLFLQVLQICLSSSNPSVVAWTLSSLCILVDLIRNYHYFKTLPLYKMKTLFYQAYLLMIVTSLSISYFVQKILKSTMNYEHSDFFWISWSVLTILTIIVSRFFLQKAMWNIILAPKTASPQLLVHKVNLIKQIIKKAITPNEYNDQYDFAYMIKKAIHSKTKAIFNIDSSFSESTNLDMNSKESADKLFLHYFESLLIIFPRSKLIKLYLAYFYAKKFKSYGKAIKLVQELGQAQGHLIRLNVSLLMFDIQNMISSRYEDPNAIINLTTYIKSQSYFAKLKKEILNQLEIQVHVYEEILSDSPTAITIIKSANKNDLAQSEIDKRIKQVFGIIPDYYVEPLAFLTHYHLILTHSVSDALKYRDLYLKKHEKYKKIFNSESLQEETVYQSQNVFFVLSGQKNDFGTILLCTKSVKKIYGRDAKSLVGKNISTLPFPPLQSLVTRALNDQVQNEDPSAFNRVVQAFGGHHEGYMVETEYHINVHPFINGNFCLVCILRKRATARDCLLVNNNGTIEGATKNIREILGLKQLEQLSPKVIPNIKDLSKELSEVIKTFNIVAFYNQRSLSDIDGAKRLDLPICMINLDTKEGEKEVDIENARVICSQYTTEGKELAIKSLSNNRSYLYHCKILNKYPPSFRKRIVILERVDDKEQKDPIKQENVGKKKIVFKTADEDDSGGEPSSLELEDEKEVGLEGCAQITHRSIFKLDKPVNSHPIQMNNINILSERLNSETDKYLGYTSEKVHTEASNLLSPHLSKYTLLKIEDPKTKSQKESLLKPSELLMMTTTENKIEDNCHKRIIKSNGSGTNNQILGDAKQLKLSNAFQAAITRKSDPKYFKALCLLLYFILIVLFIIQSYIKFTWKENVQALKVKKDILNNALLRNFYIIDSPAYFATIWNIETGKVDLSATGLNIFYLLALLKFELGNLRQINNVLLGDTNSLSEEMRQTLFYKDVRVFELCEDCQEQSYLMLDNFQATNQVIQFALSILFAAQNSTAGIRDKINLFSQNCFNDLLLKNAEIAEIFLKSLNDQRKEILTTMWTFLIITLALLTFTALFITMNICNNYAREAQNIMAVIKLNSTGVNDTLMKKKSFKEMIENEMSFEEHLSNNSDYLNSSISKRDSGGRMAKKDILKTLNSKKLSEKHYSYFAKMVISIGILLGLAVWSTKAVSNFIDTIYEKQSQLYLINLIRSRATLHGHAIGELLSNGSEKKIENIPILKFLSNSKNEITDLRTRITNVFSPETLETGSTIEKILFGDACEELGPYYAAYCNMIKTYGVRSDLIQILVNFENYVSSFYEDFIQLNETERLAYKPDSEAFNLFTAMFIILTSGESFLLINNINQAYEELLEDSKDQRDLIYYIFSGSLAAIMILLWTFLLKDLKERNNRFKKLLQMFPPHLILSNFYLKTFLTRNSKGTLDFFKNGFDHIQ